MIYWIFNSGYSDAVTYTYFLSYIVTRMALFLYRGDQVFHPDFPAGSPYITSVGGTNFQEKSVVGPESAWNCGGGGFSDTFARPAWQVPSAVYFLYYGLCEQFLP